MLFNLYFPNNNILSFFFLLFFIIDLYFLTPAVIAQILIPIAELIIPTLIAPNDANAEFEIKMSKYST